METLASGFAGKLHGATQLAALQLRIQSIKIRPFFLALEAVTTNRSVLWSAMPFITAQLTRTPSIFQAEVEVMGARVMLLHHEGVSATLCCLRLGLRCFHEIPLLPIFLKRNGGSFSLGLFC
ncbi:hypothetical protein JIN84_21575 [Luteolibacter yonseiensis]|uniref:Uncharacterized protein n=1 Tax=Luteolibacter yonseiensis TaxID=1144680 RepID=A0A934VE42_9BACT|nr:hypothetical protein [Luteolibacter yonseiensis]MBK1818229.1 hypothetical protein [Luteolibacter yonseiensis]